MKNKLKTHKATRNSMWIFLNVAGRKKDWLKKCDIYENKTDQSDLIFDWQVVLCTSAIRWLLAF